MNNEAPISKDIPQTEPDRFQELIGKIFSDCVEHISLCRETAKRYGAGDDAAFRSNPNTFLSMFNQAIFISNVYTQPKNTQEGIHVLADNSRSATTSKPISGGEITTTTTITHSIPHSVEEAESFLLGKKRIIILENTSSNSIEWDQRLTLRRKSGASGEQVVTGEIYIKTTLRGYTVDQLSEAEHWVFDEEGNIKKGDTRIDSIY